MPVPKPPTHYAVLGIPETASAAAIERAYKTRIRAAHPDRAHDEGDRLRRTREAAALNEAGRVLRDKTQRAVYDFDLEAARRADLTRRLVSARPTANADAVAPPSAASSADAAPFKPFWEEPIRAPLAGSWLDLRRRRHLGGLRPALLAFLRFNPWGQWLLVWIVWLVIVRAQTVFWPAQADELTPRLLALAVWLLLGALWARSWLRHPLGHLLRLVALLTEFLFSLLNDRAREEKP